MPSHFFELVAYNIFFDYFFNIYHVRCTDQAADCMILLSIGSQVKLNMLCHALRGIWSWTPKLVSSQLLHMYSL
jgi:hypothetical protein